MKDRPPQPSSASEHDVERTAPVRVSTVRTVFTPGPSPRSGGSPGPSSRAGRRWPCRQSPPPRRPSWRSAVRRQPRSHRAGRSCQSPLLDASRGSTGCARPSSVAKRDEGHEPGNVDRQSHDADARGAFQLVEALQLPGVPRSGEQAADQVDEEGHAVALGPADGKQGSLHGRVGVLGGGASGVEGPAGGDALLQPLRAADLAAGNDRGGHVEHDRRRAPAGGGHGKGVGAEERFGSAPRGHGGCAVARAEADHVLAAAIRV